MSRSKLTGAVLALGFLCAGDVAAQIWRGPGEVGIEVVDHRKQPVAGARIQLLFVEVEPYTGPPPTVTDNAGKAAFWDLAEGRWRVDVYHDDYAHFFALVRVQEGKAPDLIAGPIRDGTAPPLRFSFSKAGIRPVGSPGRRPQPTPPAAPQSAESERPPATRPTRPAPTPPSAPQPPPERQPEPSPTPAEPAPAPPEASGAAPMPSEEPGPAAEPSSGVRAAEPAMEAPAPEPAAEMPGPAGEGPAAGEPAAMPEPSPGAAQPEPPTAMPEPSPPVAQPEPPAAMPKPPAEAPRAETQESEPAPVMPEAAPAEEATGQAPEMSGEGPPEAPAPAPAAEMPEPAAEMRAGETAPETPAPPEPEPTMPLEPAPSPGPAPAEPAGPQTGETGELPAPAPAGRPEEMPAPPAAPETREVPAPAPPAAEPPAPQPAAAAEAPSPAPPRELAERLGLQVGVRSADTGTCPDCKPGEWALSLELAAAPGRPLPTGSTECSPEAAERFAEIARLLGGSTPVTSVSGAGPLIDPWSGAVNGAVDAALHARIAELAAPYVNGSSGCQVLAVLLPSGARFSGYAYEARDRSSSVGCIAAQECALGDAVWPDHPVIDRSDAAILVRATFNNYSPDRTRVGKLTVYYTLRR